MSSFDEDVAEFLATDKRLAHRFRWKSSRADYARASAPVFVKDERRPFARVQMNHHLARVPRKYSFSLIFRGERVVGLDIDPGRSHTNLITLEVVRSTHWQTWPLMQAVVDRRELLHHNWLALFLKECKIHSQHSYAEPPFHGGQLGLDFDV